MTDDAFMNNAMDRMPLQSILIKPAGPDCNMHCAYCFYCCTQALFPEPAPHRMSLEVLEATIRQFMPCAGGTASICWQGGEPTLMGLPFFEQAVELQARYGWGMTVANALQTNGLLIDAAWTTFLRRCSFLVGLSLDGPAHVHDRYRHHAGGGSWARVRDSAKRLLDAGVSVNAMSVVSDYAARFPDEIYATLKELGLSWMQFVPCVEADAHGHAAPFTVAPEEYGSFLCRIFDLWRDDFAGDRPTTSIRFFEALLYNYIGMTPPECSLMEECGSYVVVEHSGDCYACDFFVTPEWRLGHILQDDLAEMFHSRRQQEFRRRKTLLPAECRLCRWYRLCHGGCPKDRLRIADDKGKNHLCLALQRFFAHADPTLRQLAGQIRNNMEASRNKGPVSRNSPCPCGSGRMYKQCCGKL